MGWRQDLAQAANVATQETQSEFKIDGQTPDPPLPPIWHYTKKLHFGNHLPTFEQQVGDCVAAAIRQAGARLQVADLAIRFQEEKLKPWHVPYIYGTSRVQIGGGRLDGDGSTGAWGAAAVKQYGVLFDDDPDAPEYSGNVSREWGRRPGPPENFQATARTRPVGAYARINSIEELRLALLNLYPCTIASNRGFKMSPVEKQGRHVFEPAGTWYHQMSLIAWQDEPFPAAYRLNSWGPHAHGDPLNGEPPGGAWCSAECITDEIRNPNNELFTYSRFEGFPAAPNRGLIR